MTNSRVWILVADCFSATISTSNGSGSTTVFSAHNPVRRASCPAFAAQLIAKLQEGALAGSYDELVIVASEDMLQHIRDLKTADIEQRLVAELAEREHARAYSRQSCRNWREECVAS